uniref:Protein NDRG4 n=1 Tax=Sinocyclocheilus anshuiensis TaxID=1608454 RepID=A0A671M1B6_9TELE
MADCGGLPQVHQPGKLIEAFKYFIQGMGYSNATAAVQTRMSSADAPTLTSPWRAALAQSTVPQPSHIPSRWIFDTWDTLEMALTANKYCT